MIGKYKVITLCGSTRFNDAFMEAQKQRFKNEIQLIGCSSVDAGGALWK